MGRIEVVIPDSLDKKLRMEVVSRFGGKKGDLLRAVTEALERWLETDESKARARKLAKLIKDPKTPVGVKQDGVAALAKMGSAGLDVLIDISSIHDVPESVRSQALRALDFAGRR